LVIQLYHILKVIRNTIVSHFKGRSTTIVSHFKGRIIRLGGLDRENKLGLVNRLTDFPSKLHSIFGVFL
jgi:hypothetical protein